MLARYKVPLIALGVVLLIGVLGIGVALAADPPSKSTDYNQFYVSKLAKILGLEEQKVGDALVQARNEAMNETLDEAVKAGRLTREQAEAMKQHIQQMGPGMGPGMIGSGMMGPGVGADHCDSASGSTGGPMMGGTGNWSPMMAPGRSL